jgi:VanZ family protein
MKRWAILSGIVLVVILALADTEHLGILRIGYIVPFGDKVAHFVLFGLVCLIVNLAVFEARPRIDTGKLALRTTLLLAVPVALEEFSQRWIRSRNPSLFDLAASYLGMVLFAWLAVRIAERSRSSEPSAKSK